MKVTKPHEKIIHIQCDNLYQLTSSFMRIQEYYESNIPCIRNNYFSMEKFMDCYAAEFGNFSYCIDWVGFNVPGHVIDKFFTLFAHDLLVKEKYLRDLISDSVSTSRYYVIGTIGSSKSAINHELAHAMYYLCPTYKADMQQCISSLSLRRYNAIKRVVLDMGYTKEVVDDEIQAYLATSSPSELTKLFGKDVTPQISEHFKVVFRSHCKRNGIKTKSHPKLK